MLRSSLALLPLALRGVVGAALFEQRADTCTDVHIFVTRGNDEPYPGRQGALTDAICNYFPSCAAEHIEYDNPSAPACDALDKGPQLGISQITAYNKLCPKSIIVLTGYSQGAQTMGDILGGGGGQFWQCEEPTITGFDPQSGVGSMIAAALLWGDERHTANQPYNVLSGSAKNGYFPRSGAQLTGLNRWSDRLRSYCVVTDPICARGDDGNTHTTYFDLYDSDAAAWVNNMVKAFHIPVTSTVSKVSTKAIVSTSSKSSSIVHTTAVSSSSSSASSSVSSSASVKAASVSASATSSSSSSASISSSASVSVSGSASASASDSASDSASASASVQSSSTTVDALSQSPSSTPVESASASTTLDAYSQAPSSTPVDSASASTTLNAYPQSSSSAPAESPSTTVDASSPASTSCSTSVESVSTTLDAYSQASAPGSTLITSVASYGYAASTPAASSKTSLDFTDFYPVMTANTVPAGTTYSTAPSSTPAPDFSYVLATTTASTYGNSTVGSNTTVTSSQPMYTFNANAGSSVKQFSGLMIAAAVGVLAL